MSSVSLTLIVPACTIPNTTVPTPCKEKKLYTVSIRRKFHHPKHSRKNRHIGNLVPYQTTTVTTPCSRDYHISSWQRIQVTKTMRCIAMATSIPPRCGTSPWQQIQMTKPCAALPWQPTYRHGVYLADRELCRGLGVVPVSDWRLEEIEELVQQVEVLPRHVRDLEYGA
jgi:hypothetical protein